LPIPQETKNKFQDALWYTLWICALPFFNLAKYSSFYITIWITLKFSGWLIEDIIIKESFLMEWLEIAQMASAFFLIFLTVFHTLIDIFLEIRRKWGGA